MKKLAIFGTGGMGRETAQWARECGYEEIIFAVDDNYLVNPKVDELQVIPFSKIRIEEFVWLVGIANSVLRETTIRKIQETAKFATLIHPTARVQRSSTIGEGAIVGPGSGISVNTKIGRHVIVNAQSIVGHDSIVGDFATISPCVAVLGNCKIGSHVFIGANSSIKEGVTISNETVVGMGTVVITNLSAGVYVGNPARKIQ